jgi:Type II/IV secretion system protein/Type II secretion system (T2SS), protein E, N-terminal domain
MEASPSFDPRRLRIGALLLRGGLLDAEQLAEALDEKEVTGERLGQIVLRRGWVTEEALAQTLADQSGLDFVDLDTATRESRAELLLSGKLARYFRCVPLAVLDEQTVLVAAADPASPLLADLPSAIGHEIRVALATETAIERVLGVLDPEGAQQSPPPLLDQPAEPPALDPLVEPSGEPLLRLSVVPSEPTDESEPEPDVKAETTLEHEDADADTSQPEPDQPEPEQADAPHSKPEPTWLTWHQPAVDTRPDHTDEPKLQPEQPEPEQAEAPQSEPEPSWLSWHQPAVEDHADEPELQPEQPQPEQAEAPQSKPEPTWLTWHQPAVDTRPDHTDEPELQPEQPHLEQNEALPEHQAPEPAQPWSLWLKLRHEQQPEPPTPADSDEEPAAAVADPTDLPDRLMSDAGRSVQFAVSATSDVERALEHLYQASPVETEPEPEQPVAADEASGETDPADETVTEVDPPTMDDTVASELDGRASLDDGEASEVPLPSLGELWSRGSHVSAEPDPDAMALVVPEASARRGTDLDELGLGPDAVAALRAALDQPHGIVLAIGPAVSGRTTTLRTALDMLVEPSRAVVAVEGRSAQGKALRMALQSDPGILLIDDLDHPGTARAAVEAALRGHLVLSTLHAPTPGSAVARLTGAGIERQVLAATLTCVAGQRLARRLCPSCREPYDVGRSSLIASGFGDTYLPATPFVGVYEPRGCSECDGGYARRIGLFEVLSVSAPIRRILETGNASDIDGAAGYGGTRTLLADGLRHCLAGRTSLAEVRRVVGARAV